MLLKDNEELREKQHLAALMVVPSLNHVALSPLQPEPEPEPSSDAIDTVETELYIGLPGRERASNRQSG